MAVVRVPRFCVRFVAVAVLASVALAILPFTAGRVLATCSLTEGDDEVYKFAGDYEVITGVEGVKAYLNYYNPDPVYGQTTFWVMLDNNADPQRYAQVGWIKRENWSDAYVWLQFTQDNGVPYELFYDHPNSQWIGTPTTVPLNNMYEVTYDPSTDTFTFKYGTGPTYGVSYTWVPARADAMAETYNFRSVSPTNYGDHTVGDSTDKVKAEIIQRKSNGGSYDHMSPSGGGVTLTEGNHSTDTNYVAFTGFRVWDSRCSS